MDFNKQEALRAIPSVNDILESNEIEGLVREYGKERVIDSIRKLISDYRKLINSHDQLFESFDRLKIKSDIIDKLAYSLYENNKPALRRVINATGIILHTNLGRAPLPVEALNAVLEVSGSYSNLEYNLDKGTRGSRHQHIEDIVCRLTGAESAMVVNNNAAAVFLCLNTLANGKKVVVSRGEQIEIGGSFRIPDIIVRSGADMLEVGTTNKTHLEDYESAINEFTAILMKVHTSNFKIVGFTEQVGLADLVKLAEKHGLYVFEDLGSGSFLDLTQFGLPYEPTVQESIRTGADLVTFSGDKLLGGPQAGIIAGKKELIDRIKKNPLARMVRCDKMTIAALEAVLRLYINPGDATGSIPVLRMLARNEDQLEKDAAELMRRISDVINDKCDIRIVDDIDETGGGSLPGVTIKGKAVALILHETSAGRLQESLRKCDPPVICTVKRNMVFLSLRTIQYKEYGEVAGCLKKALGEL